MEHQSSSKKEGTYQEILKDIKVGRDVNANIHQQNTTYIGNDSEQKTINIHLREQRKKIDAEFQTKLEQIASLLEELKSSIEYQIKHAAPQDKKKISDLLERLNQLTQKQQKITTYKTAKRAGEEAARWLEINVNDLVQYGVTEAFDTGNHLELRTPYEQESITRVKRLFYQDLTFYFSWLSEYVNAGVAPKSIKTHHIKINLVFEVRVYQYIFNKIMREVIGRTEEISEEAAQTLIRYFNKELIKRDLTQDI